jgi:hypothetical protein
MPAHYDEVNMTKRIDEDQTRVVLGDCIANLLLVFGGDRSTVEAIIADSWERATRDYEAEKGGDSEGYRVLVKPQDGVTYALDGGLA